MASECLFCKITRGEAGTEFLYENEKVVVFRDIHPQAPIHLLIVSKKHIRSVNDLAEADRDIVAEMVMVAKEVAKAQNVAESGYKLLFNVERGGGQVIFHMHMHMLVGWKP